MKLDDQPLLNVQNGGSFVYTSPHRSLITSGCFTTIEATTSDGHDLAGSFQRRVLSALEDASAAGIANPVVVGAIPFDVTQPSALFIPESVQFLSRHELETDSLNTCNAPRVPVTDIKLTPGRQEFEAMVSQGIAATRQGAVDKVVLSRIVDVSSPEPLDATALFQRLNAQNPNSFNFHVPLPSGGTLVGASPELLLRREGHTFTTMPLAGSARRDACNSGADWAAGQALLSSRKDLYEHKLVADQVCTTLSAIAHLDDPDAQPELVATPTLWHLGTRVTGTTAEESSTLSLACLLHPTPALSGSPDRAARRLIRDLEPFDRGLFGGLVGWCDSAGNGEWAVAIRCAEVQDNRARLFAGAGIVPASDPAAEWRETEAKLTTMLNALGLSGAVREFERDHGRACL